MPLLGVLLNIPFIAPSPPAENREKTMPGSHRILIVDDEPHMCESLQVLLAGRGFEVQTAGSGRHGLRALTRSSFDLVLLDLMLPDMSGLAVLEHIRKEYPGVLVIIFSGYASIDSAVAALKIGAFDYIRKPVEYEELLKRVENALEQRRLTKEKEAIQWELDQSRKRYQFLVESSPDIIYTLDEQGRFSFVNDAFERLLGMPRDRVLGRHYSEIVFPQDLGKSQHVFNERRTGRRAGAGTELRLAAGPTAGPTAGRAAGRAGQPAAGAGAAGSQLPVEVKAQGIYDREPQEKDKRFLGTYGVARDIRERKALEEHLQQEEKMEAVARLAGGIAHDFNNFLAAIVGNVALAKMQTRPGQEVFARLDEMERAALRARGLTRQLITFARGGVAVKRPGSLADLIRDAATFVLRGSNVSCVFELPKDLWGAEFDSGQITQVVQNLAINADQAMPEGGKLTVRGENVTVTSSYGLPLSPGRYVRITVQDQGCGIAEDNLGRVFDPFFTTKQNGTGFGLSTAYSIMKNHGGHLSVESEVGVGSRFYLFLPASEGRVEPDEKERRPIHGGRGKILVMDDDRSLLDVYGRLLSHLGYDPTVVVDGAEALERYREARQGGEPYAAVIMDLTVPGAMGGREAIKRLLALDPRAVAIIASGYTNDPVLANFRQYGFREVMSKPFTAEKLSEVLWRALKRGS
jgi:two-component system cell cycle sensor histidine kinase/response regulator CckA